MVTPMPVTDEEARRAFAGSSQEAALLEGANAAANQAQVDSWVKAQQAGPVQVSAALRPAAPATPATQPVALSDAPAPGAPGMGQNNPMGGQTPGAPAYGEDWERPRYASYQVGSDTYRPTNRQIQEGTPYSTVRTGRSTMQPVAYQGNIEDTVAGGETAKAAFRVQLQSGQPFEYQNKDGQTIKIQGKADGLYMEAPEVVTTQEATQEALASERDARKTGLDLEAQRADIAAGLTNKYSGKQAEIDKRMADTMAKIESEMSTRQAEIDKELAKVSATPAPKIEDYFTSRGKGSKFLSNLGLLMAGAFSGPEAADAAARNLRLAMDSEFQTRIANRRATIDAIGEKQKAAKDYQSTVAPAKIAAIQQEAELYKAQLGRLIEHHTKGLKSEAAKANAAAAMAQVDRDFASMVEAFEAPHKDSVTRGEVYDPMRTVTTQVGGETYKQYASRKKDEADYNKTVAETGKLTQEGKPDPALMVPDYGQAADPKSAGELREWRVNYGAAQFKLNKLAELAEKGSRLSPAERNMAKSYATQLLGDANKLYKFGAMDKGTQQLLEVIIQNPQGYFSERAGAKGSIDAFRSSLENQDYQMRSSYTVAPATGTSGIPAGFTKR